RGARCAVAVGRLWTSGRCDRCRRAPRVRTGMSAHRLAAIIGAGAVLAATPGMGPLAAVHAIDDAGVTLTLERPARRIISLAPHVTELLFAAGAGDRIVGTIRYS